LNTSSDFNSKSILPSLRGSPNPLVFSYVSDADRTYWLAPGQSTIPPGRTPIVLGSWTPTAADIDVFKSVDGWEFEQDVSQDLHVCVLAQCDGSLPPSSDGTANDGKVGDWADLALASTSFCADIHHAQLNTTLHRTLSKNALTLPFYAGIGPQKREQGGTTKVFLREEAFEPQADHGLVEMIRRAGLGGLPIQPAIVPARVAGIARFRSAAKRIEQRAEEITHEVLEHLRGRWAEEDDESNPGTPRNVLTLQLAPGELLPLLMKVAFDKDDPLGTVHVFDVIQLNQDGTRGGFRLATIHTPAE
jgi:hypothetical protein